MPARHLLALLAVAACTTHVPAKEGIGSFAVEIVAIDPFTKSAACADAPDNGTEACPRPYPGFAAPVNLTLRIRALDRDGNFFADYDAAKCAQEKKACGSAQLDVRPGRFANVGPAGVLATFVQGESIVDVTVVYAFGKTRLWVEDCGTTSEAGSFALGTSQDLFFDRPTITEVNEVRPGLEPDSWDTETPLGPEASNVCAITGDPRYGIGLDRDGNVAFVGYSHGRLVDAPPPAMGNYVEMVGCSRAEHDAEGGCARGPLVVTGIGNEGFFVTDISASARTAGYNHLFVFNFNYPDDLEVGDIVTSIRGSPEEFPAGSTTQLGSPSWDKDTTGTGKDLLPLPVHILKEDYRDSVRTFGRNDDSKLALEKLESALVCMDGLAPAGRLVRCDVNESGGIERQGCLYSGPEPIRCEDGVSLVPQPPDCEGAPVPYCLELSQAEKDACALTGYAPENAFEYCCERICYNDLSCSETATFIGYGQWSAEVFGRYTEIDSLPVKVALITRDADPDFDPIAFGAAQREVTDPTRRKKLRLIGNLRQVLAARPVWVIEARSPADIAIDGEPCETNEDCSKLGECVCAGTSCERHVCQELCP